MSEICRRHRIWLHVDGAYGAFATITDRGKRALSGIELADSITLDPHKGFFLPFGTGCLLVRDPATLRAAHSGDDAHYLQDIDAADLPDFADLGPELTRPFRGLPLWLPLHLHGVAAFRAALDEKLDLAQWTYTALLGEPALHVYGAPALTTVAFRCADDDATAELLRRVNAEQRVRLSSTRIDGRFVGRVTVLSHRTDRARVEEGVAAIRRHAQAL